KPGVENLPGKWLGGGAETECQYIGMVPDAGTTCSLSIAAERRAYAGHFVCRNRRARARPAADDPFVGVACRHGLRHLSADQRPVRVSTLTCQRAERHEFMAPTPQLLHQGIGEMGALVAANCDLHRSLLIETVTPLGLSHTADQCRFYACSRLDTSDTSDTFGGSAAARGWMRA